MAGIITHTYFVLDLYDKLSIKSKELIIDKKEFLKFFAQSNNVLAYYNCKDSKKKNKIRNFNNTFHTNKTYEFFSNLINYIKYNQFYYNPEVMAYLYGMLSHYVLDSTINPFIIYKSGSLNNSLHTEIESYLDNYLYTIREGMNPHKLKCYNLCFNIDYFSNELIEVMDFTYKETFGISNFHKYYFSCCMNAKKFYKRYRYDPVGIKKKFYSIIDYVLPDSYIKKAPLSYHLNKKDKTVFFNLEHKKWYNPTDKRTKSCESILELYTKALSDATKIIQEINQYFYYDKKVNLKKVIGNLNYYTGKDCSKEKELKYFEF